MRFTRYGKYTGNLADALNLQALLDQLGDFLLQSGFAGGRIGTRTGARAAGKTTSRSTR
jgi:Ca-activated chloride channel family protein